MKHLRLFLFLNVFILLLHTLSTAQEDIDKKSVVIKFSPLCLVDPNYPAIQLGVEFRIKNTLSYQQEIGYITRDTNRAPTDSIPSGSGIKIRSEIRNYFLLNIENRTMSGLYTALEPFYTYTYFYRRGTFIDDHGNNCSEVYKIDKHVIGINGKIGYQKIFSSGITIDIYIGIGAKYRKITHLEKDCDSKTIKYSAGYLFAGAEMEGEKIVPNLPISIKFGYAF